MHKRIVIIDTNCVLPILGVHTKYHVLWKKFLNNEFILGVSTEIVHEYEEMLTSRSGEKVAKLFLDVLQRANNVIVIEPSYKFNLITADPDDNKFVDCAIACHADYIVSEDSHFKVLSEIPFPLVKVIKLDDFLSQIYNVEEYN